MSQDHSPFGSARLRMIHSRLGCLQSRRGTTITLVVRGEASSAQTLRSLCRRRCGNHRFIDRRTPCAGGSQRVAPRVKSSAQITTFCALDKYGSSHWPAVLSTLELLRCRECRCTWAACKSKRREPKYSVHRVPLRFTSRASRSSILQARAVAAQTDSFAGIPLQPAHASTKANCW